MTSNAVEISVIIPAYNEGRRIASSLMEIKRHFGKLQRAFEIVVVDDGSSDDTVSIVQAAADNNPVLRLVRNDRNRGKGYSVRHGVLESHGKLVLFSDADLSAPIEESAKLLEAIEQRGLDVAIGSRALNRQLIGARQPWLREQSGKVFNACVRLILGLPYVDTQCGFKAFRREAVLPIFQRQCVFGFGFDPELLYVARLHGLKVGEVAVQWNHVPGSKVSFLSDSIHMFCDLIRIRWNHLRGKYEWEE
jgi:glycosyltransferase involved in cell wall biosynthesis